MPETPTDPTVSTGWVDPIPVLWITPPALQAETRLVIRLNGLTGTKEQMLPYLQDLAAAGFVALRFDAWQHGERGTEGQRDNISTRLPSLSNALPMIPMAA